jgi:L,D-peptidoglycan transpeptidase YkuD (ErfK/YbiS/YcfS/YnhG family)
MAGLAAAVLGICGCAAAGPTYSAVAQPYLTRASSAAAGALAATFSAAPAAASAARRPSGQLVTVVAASYGATEAELTAYRRAGGRWRRVLGPWVVWIGRDGMARPGAKREGDGRTPSASPRITMGVGTPRTDR